MIDVGINPIMQFFASPDTKFYLGLAGLVWTASKGFNWVKDIREKDLKGLKEDMGTVSTELRQQTNVISTGFSTLLSGVHDLRSDFRTFYTSPDPLMVPVRARATRKRKSVAARKEAKAAPRRTKAK